MMIDSTPTDPKKTPSRENSSPRRGILVLVVIAVAVTAVFLPWSSWFGSQEAVGEATAEVKEVLRGDIVITVTAQGALKASRSVWVISEIEASAQILKIIEEGARVKKGDWLCTLDTTNLENQKEKQELAKERAESSHLQAKASYNITLKQNESEIAQAELELTFARIDLEKFLGMRQAEVLTSTDRKDPPAQDDTDRKGDRDVQIQEQQNKIKLADMELKNAKEVYEWSEKLHTKDYITKNELDRDMISWERARLNLALAQARMQNLLDFDLRKQLKRLRADVREAELNLARVKERCEQKRIQTETDLRSKERQLNLEESQLERIEKQIASGRICAPQHGLVVYANQSSRWRRGREDPIAEGVSVRYHQKIISLPDVSEIIVEVSIHESARSQVWRGQQAVIKVEALEGKVFRGTVDKVPEVPDSSSGWLTPDRKVYKTRIRVEGESADIRPGMSAVVTVYCEKLENILYIPIQAVFTAGKETRYVHVKRGGSPETRIIEVGKHNDKNVQVLSGLKEGELVYLSEPENAVPPAVPKKKNGDRIPEGLKVTTKGKPEQASDDAPGEGQRSGRGRRRTGMGDPARMLERIKQRYPDLYEEIKDLPQEKQIEKIQERFKSMRGRSEERRRSGDREERGSRGPRSRNPRSQGPRSQGPGGEGR